MMHIELNATSLAACRHGEQSLASIRCCSRSKPTVCLSVCDSESMGDGSQPSQTAPKTCVEAVAATASQARAECKAQGMRLCRLEELRGQSGACCKSGCSFDAERVWTADKCQPTAEDIQRRELEAAEAAALDARLRRTLASCGPLCNTSRPVLREPGGPARFATTTAPIRCDALYNLDDEASAAEAHRPLLRSELPSQWILDAFTMAGRYPLSPGQGMSQQYLGQTAMVPFWGEAMVEEMVSKARSRRLAGNYGADETNRLLEGLRRAALSGKSVLVIGSENPWVEAACLAEGAAHVTTLEYGKISTDHPKLTTFTPAAFRAARRAARLPRFGAVVTFSSVEHSGLGRYGDALNPWGDLIAIGRAWCVADDDAKLVIGVMSGRDRIEWNAHRRYGALRYPYLATNWRLEWASEKGKQRVHVFQRFVDPAPTLTPLPPEPSRASRCAASAGSEAAAVAPVAAASAVAAAQDGRPPRLHAATAGTAPRAHAKRAGRRLHAEREGDESPQALSVAIATCRRADHLKRVLPIYLRHPRVSDVVVTDDCSTDAEALRAWLASGALEPAAAAKLTVVANARQLWPLANKLSAVERARGPWVAVLDSDNTALASYFDTLFDFWRRTPADPTTIYTPQRLLRPQAGPDGHLGAHLAVGFDFTLLVGRPCDAASWSTCAKSSASAVLNAGNNVVHRETALRAWRPAVQRSSTSAKDVWLDSQLMNRLMVEQVRFEPLPRTPPPPSPSSLPPSPRPVAAASHVRLLSLLSDSAHHMDMAGVQAAGRAQFGVRPPGERRLVLQAGRPRCRLAALVAQRRTRARQQRSTRAGRGGLARRCRRRVEHIHRRRCALLRWRRSLRVRLRGGAARHRGRGARAGVGAKARDQRSVDDRGRSGRRVRRARLAAVRTQRARPVLQDGVWYGPADGLDEGGWRTRPRMRARW